MATDPISGQRRRRDWSLRQTAVEPRSARPMQSQLGEVATRGEWTLLLRLRDDDHGGMVSVVLSAREESDERKRRRRVRVYLVRFFYEFF